MRVRQLLDLLEEFLDAAVRHVGEDDVHRLALPLALHGGRGDRADGRGNLGDVPTAAAWNLYKELSHGCR